ncbi:MAG: hypothetical protein IPN70_04800 [Candidatus Moraniibacteriota bacterium]|nr:MAG: hypothetical protein IPN70_04800 [Candidatus Moranbacteria bacterium]
MKHSFSRILSGWTGYGVQRMSNQPTPWWLTILGILAFADFWVGVFPRHRESADWRRSDPEGKENAWIATSQIPRNDTPFLINWLLPKERMK